MANRNCVEMNREFHATKARAPAMIPGQYFFAGSKEVYILIAKNHLRPWGSGKAAAARRLGDLP